MSPPEPEYDERSPKMNARRLAVPIAALTLLVTLGSGTHAAATPFVHEIVDPTGIVGQYTSLALDASGHPRISYYDVTNGDLKYAAKNGATWTIETVDGASGDVGQYTSLA